MLNIEHQTWEVKPVKHNKVNPPYGLSTTNNSDDHILRPSIKHVKPMLNVALRTLH